MVRVALNMSESGDVLATKMGDISQNSALEQNTVKLSSWFSRGVKVGDVSFDRDSLIDYLKNKGGVELAKGYSDSQTGASGSSDKEIKDAFQSVFKTLIVTSEPSSSSSISKLWNSLFSKPDDNNRRVN